MSLRLEKEKMRFNRYVLNLLQDVNKNQLEFDVNKLILVIITNYLGITPNYIRNRVQFIIETERLNLFYDEKEEKIKPLLINPQKVQSFDNKEIGEPLNDDEE